MSPLYGRQTDVAPKILKTYNMKHKTLKLISTSCTAYQILAKIDKLYLALK